MTISSDENYNYKELKYLPSSQAADFHEEEICPTILLGQGPGYI